MFKKIVVFSCLVTLRREGKFFLKNWFFFLCVDCDLENICVVKFIYGGLLSTWYSGNCFPLYGIWFPLTRENVFSHTKHWKNANYIFHKNKQNVKKKCVLLINAPHIFFNFYLKVFINYSSLTQCWGKVRSPTLKANNPAKLWWVDLAPIGRLWHFHLHSSLGIARTPCHMYGSWWSELGKS